MPLPKRRKVRTFALLFCVLTFSYTFWDPSLYFIKYALHQSNHFFSKGPCACRRCVAELEDGEPWFSERFNQTVHPLMTRENSALSDETFKWWQVRQRHRSAPALRVCFFAQSCLKSEGLSAGSSHEGGLPRAIRELDRRESIFFFTFPLYLNV